MNIFITGATGFIGRHLLASLLDRTVTEDRIFVLVRRLVPFNDKRVVTLFGGLDSMEAFRNEILSAHFIFHLAANPTFGDDVDYDSVNYLPTVRLADMAKGSSILKNLIYVSSIGAMDRMPTDTCQRPLDVESIPNPRSAYGRSKLKSEKYIRDAGVPYTIIRPTWVYGEGMRTNSHINKFVTMVYGNSPVAKFSFPGRVSVIHVKDLADVMSGCIDNDRVIGKTYFAETEALSIGEIFNIIHRRIHGKTAGQIRLPAPRGFFRRFHRNLPLEVSNLFLDYLCASDPRFLEDFGLQKPRRLRECIDDVITTHVHNGYWVVTGANSGIGYALATKLNRMNKRLILVDRDVSNLKSFGSHVILKADLGNADSLSGLAKKIGSYRIFCLINNAGIGFRGGIATLDAEQIQRTMDVNIRYPVLLTKLLLERLIADNSVIVNIASSSAFNPLPNMSVYAASKAFLLNWSESLSYELHKTNTVITISPAGTHSNFQKAAGVKVVSGGRGLLSPEFVADSILNAVNIKKRVVILGRKAKLLLLISRCLPRKINITLWGRLFEVLR